MSDTPTPEETPETVPAHATTGADETTTGTGADTPLEELAEASETEPEDAIHPETEVDAEEVQPAEG